jgi:excisionase family DNA binding protein
MNKQRKNTYQPRPASGDDDLLRMRDVSHYLNCSPAQAYRLAHRGLIPMTRFGGMVRVSRRGLMEAIEKNTKVVE